MTHYINTPEEMGKICNTVCDKLCKYRETEYPYKCYVNCPLDALADHPVNLIKINNKYREV